MAVVSPNSLTKTQIYTYSMPCRRQENAGKCVLDVFCSCTDITTGPSSHITFKTPMHTISHELFLSILRKTPPYDISHELTLTSTPIYAVRNVFSDLLAIFVDYPQGVKEWLTREAIGLAVDIYR